MQAWDDGVVGLVLAVLGISVLMMMMSFNFGWRHTGRAVVLVSDKIMFEYLV